MQITDFIKRLEILSKLNDQFSYSIGETINLNNIKNVEKRLSINVPEKVCEFYLSLNGLRIKNPQFEIIDMNNWIIETGFIHFATFDNSTKIYFDIHNLNEVQEWDIINRTIDYELTKTISSFWSNKIWKWIEFKKQIWLPDWFKDK
jgi:hypothetical protein